MKRKLIAILLSLTLVMSLCATAFAAPGNTFTDVKDGAYYYDAVLWAVEKGVTLGTSATTFGPSEACTRAQVVTFLWRAAGSPAPAVKKCPFTDVKDDAYYYDAVMWAVENEITAGTSATTFGPNESCTRAQVVTFLYRYAGSPRVSEKGLIFTDVSSGAYYCTAVLWAVEKGVTEGTSATTFSPSSICTRAQIVTFLYRAIGSGTGDPDPTEPTDAPTELTEAPTEATEAPTEPTEAPTQPTEAPTEPTEAPTQPTEAPTEPTEATEGFAVKITAPQGADIWVYNTQNVTGKADVVIAAGETGMVYARGTQGAIDTSGSGQVNFLVVPDEGWEVDTVTAAGSYKNLKGPDETGTPNAWRITKITAGDVVVTVTLKIASIAPTEPTEAPTEPTEVPTEPTEAPTQPTEAPTEPTEVPTQPTEAPTEPTEAPTEPTEVTEGFAVQLTAPQGADIWVYNTQNVTGKADVVIAAGETATVFARNTQGAIDTSGSGQINFLVVPDEGWEVDTVTAAGSYKNLKGPDETGTENAWRVTKITAGDVVVTVTLKVASVAPTEPTEAPTEPTEAPTEPTETPTQPTEAPTEPTEAPTEPTEPTESYAVKITAPDYAEIWVYNTQAITGRPDTVIMNGETGTVYARSTQGAIDTSGDGQVNFLIVPDQGWEVDTVTATGSYKNLKGPDETGTENAWRVTKITAGDVVVTVTVKEEGDPGIITTGPTYFVFSDDGITVSGNTANSYNINGTALSVSGEGTYYVSGSCKDGSITVKKGTTGVLLILNGLTLTSSDTAPITCNKSTEVVIEAAAGTVNTLTDSTYNNDDNYPDNANAENAVIKTKDGSIVTICGTGTINVIAKGKNGVKGGATTEAEGTACLTIKEVTLNITCTANDGLKSDQELNILSGNITISAVDDGIKSDYVLNIGASGTDGPTINVVNSYEGIEAATLNIYSGNITVHSTDDGMNAANSDLTGYSFALNIYGGTLYIDAANGDGLDSNGTMTLAGGTIEVHASSRNDNSPLDSDRTMALTGGTVIAIGSNGMAQTPNSASQPYLSIGAGGMGGPGGGGPGGGGPGGPGGPGQPGQPGSSISIAAGDSIVIKDAGGNVLYSTTAVRAANYVFFSCAALVSGQTYTLYINGTSAASVTAR